MLILGKNKRSISKKIEKEYIQRLYGHQRPISNAVQATQASSRLNVISHLPAHSRIELEAGNMCINRTRYPLHRPKMAG